MMINPYSCVLQRPDALVLLEQRVALIQCQCVVLLLVNVYRQVIVLHKRKDPVRQLAPRHIAKLLLLLI